MIYLIMKTDVLLSRGLLSGDFSTWRLLFLGGMATGALAVGALMPSAVEVFPESFGLVRASVGGLLVGLGAGLGNGCTSGHGISGNARRVPSLLALVSCE